MVVFTPLWINLPVESEPSGWSHAQSQAALSTHCSQILAPLGWWYCSGGLDVVGICSLHPSKSPSLQSACSSGPGTWSSLPHSFPSLKYTEKGWKGVGACVWRLSTHLLAAHALMAWDNTWSFRLKSTPWRCCLLEFPGKIVRRHPRHAESAACVEGLVSGVTQPVLPESLNDTDLLLRNSITV